jgi:hypothetical protein
MKKLKIYMGWDSREPLAFDVARHSILRRTSLPKATQIIPLELQHLGHILTRAIEERTTETGQRQLWCPISDAPMSTEFAISRFCVPFLQKDGWALFLDCDIVCLDDIAKLFALADEKFAVMVVKHDHKPTEAVHMDGQIQTQYARKNWSSVVLWNCSHEANKNLTLEKLNTWPGRDLHAFKWLKDEEIGALPLAWNQLIGVTATKGTLMGEISIAHYTNGGPWMKDWTAEPADEIWLEEQLDFIGKKLGVA